MLGFLLLMSTAAADLPPASPRAVDFVKDVRPILAQSCFKCHGPDKQRGGLRLDVKALALKGGDNFTPAIVPGKGEESPLVQFVAGLDPDQKMPPQGEPLSAEQVGILRAWIDQGASWPEAASAKVEDRPETHYAFQPVRRPEIPKPSHKGTLVRNPIDAFIAAKLDASGLAMSPEADKRTLVRRLYLVLHGLPPTPEQVARFVADERPEAFEELVDELLDSPRYGERWGRHWLDVIAFGETHGFEVNTPRENAWPYRDYVIEAFNKDTPYPRFILEQIAGDTLGEDRATGFLVASAALLPGQIGRDEESQLKARQDELNDMVAGAGSAFLGLTLHCARCHDHKFDPVKQSDYYAMQAIFAGTRHGERELRPADWDDRLKKIPELRVKIDALSHRLLAFEPLADPKMNAEPRRVPIHPRKNVDHFPPVRTSKVRFSVQKTTFDRYEPCLDELEIYTAGPESRNVALASAGAKTSASGTIEGSTIHRLEHLNDGRYGNERSWIGTEVGKGWVIVELAEPAEINTVVWGRDRNGVYRDRLAQQYTLEVADEAGAWKLVAASNDRESWPGEEAAPRGVDPSRLTPEQAGEYAALSAQLSGLEKELRELSAMPRVYAGTFTEPGPTHRLQRGDPMQAREQIAPAAVASIGSPLQLPADAPERERRIALAKWLGDPANPLPSRVLVNRLWQHHFGSGLVRTPSDFGKNGARPTHPELLDWLASEFVERGWSIKAMQRLIVTSATWRQSSKPRPEALAKDAATQNLWRFPPRRLEAEAIRDSMLAVSGTLDLRMGGPGFLAFAPNNNYVRVYDPKTEYGPADWRRMIYQTKVRMAQDSTFGAFDCPDAGQRQPERPRSTTPLQALNLFNSQFVSQQAGLFAERLGREAGKDVDAEIRRAYQLTMGRLPDEQELQLCRDLVQSHDMTALCRVLLNANEFLFVP